MEQNALSTTSENFSFVGTLYPLKSLHFLTFYVPPTIAINGEKKVFTKQTNGTFQTNTEHSK